MLCRDESLRKLTRLLSGSTVLPSSLFVLGPPQSGKTLLVSTVLAANSKLRSAVTSCHPGTVHPRAIFESLLAQLHGVTRIREDGFAAPIKCESMAEFAEHLEERRGELTKDRSGLVLVLRKAEKLRELDFNLLPGFLRLQELTGVNVCVVLLSSISFNKFLVPQGLPRPIKVEVRAYEEEELATIVAAKLREKEESRLQSESEKKLPLGDEFYLKYSHTVLTCCYNSCNSLPRLLQLASAHFPLYCGPVIRGEVEPDNVRALYRQVEKPLKDAINHMHLQETVSTQLAAADATLKNVANARLHVELPFHSKFLLIAAYLASYNPAKTDRRFFMKHHGKQRKTTAGIKAKENRTSSQLTGPKAFPLDRMMAIFYSIIGETEGEVGASANVLSQVSSLVTLQFLIQLNSGDCLDQPKYKCIVGLDMVAQMARQVEFEIHRYLYDYC